MHVDLGLLHQVDGSFIAAQGFDQDGKRLANAVSNVHQIGSGSPDSDTNLKRVALVAAESLDVYTGKQSGFLTETVECVLE